MYPLIEVCRHFYFVWASVRLWHERGEGFALRGSNFRIDYIIYAASEEIIFALWLDERVELLYELL